MLHDDFLSCSSFVCLHLYKVNTIIKITYIKLVLFACKNLFT